MTGPGHDCAGRVQIRSVMAEPRSPAPGARRNIINRYQGGKIGRIKSEQRREHLGLTKACSRNCLGEKGTEKKEATSPLTRPRCRAVGAWCTPSPGPGKAGAEQTWTPGGPREAGFGHLSPAAPRHPGPTPSGQPSLPLPKPHFTLLESSNLLWHKDSSGCPR